MNNQKTNEGQPFQPTIPAHVSMPEITVKVIILGVILTIVLAAANAYLGLKLGQTISASIPAAVISMGILRFFKNSNVLENTMVQTMASVGEALISGIAFILPALLILRVWTHFDYWYSVAIGLLGGFLGVLFTIPLRRALLEDKTLRYPEGVAITNVLNASVTNEAADLRSLTMGGLVGALIALFQSGFEILRESWEFWTKSMGTVMGCGVGFSPALIAAGYIVGFNVCMSLLVGLFIGWVFAVPILIWIHGIPLNETAQAIARTVWLSEIRYIGVGTMLVGGLWTLVTLMKPVTRSIHASVRALSQLKKTGAMVIPRTDRDIPINIVFWAMLLLLVPIFFLVAYGIIPLDLNITSSFRMFISGFSTLYILIAGFVFCSIIAYFVGLVGTTNSPLSGVLVSALLIFCMMLLMLFNSQAGFIATVGKEVIGATVAIGGSVIIAAALAISNDTMQDLKVGQLVGATPWKQQVMLIVGVVVSAFVLPPIMELLFQAYGIGGVFPRPGMNEAQMLAAPQAGLMAAVAQGAFSYKLPWGMIATGAVIAVICIVIDEILKRRNKRLPVLAVGIGIYLPIGTIMSVVLGGVLSYFAERTLLKRYPVHLNDNEKKIASHKHKGLLVTCGIVAGASIMGVILAIPFTIKQSSDALRLLPEGYETLATWLSIIVTVAMCMWIYRVVCRRTK